MTIEIRELTRTVMNPVHDKRRTGRDFRAMPMFERGARFVLHTASVQQPWEQVPRLERIEFIDNDRGHVVPIHDHSLGQNLRDFSEPVAPQTVTECIAISGTDLGGSAHTCDLLVAHLLRTGAITPDQLCTSLTQMYAALDD